MSNMTVNQRNQFERIDLSVPTTGVHVRNRGLVIAYRSSRPPSSALSATPPPSRSTAGPQAIVLGVIMLTAVGAMIAVSPLRRG